MHRVRPLLIDNGRNAFEVWILVSCVITGTLGLLAEGRTRSSVIELLPGWMAQVWFAGLLVGAATALAGLALPIRRLRQGLQVERIGMCVLAGLLGGYAAALLVLLDWNLPVGGAQLIAGAVACVARVLGITLRDLPHLRAAVLALGIKDTA